MYPAVRLALSGSKRPGYREKIFKGELVKSYPPSLLVSYYYLKPFKEEAQANGYVYREWVLDSGAFSAFNTGAEIKLYDYIEEIKSLRDSDDPPSEVFALDSIDDWRLSEKNTRAMWKAGIEAIPAYHYGEPESVLVGLARDYPKIALGGMVPRHVPKLRFIDACFNRVWPCRMHSFGVAARSIIMAYPFETCDATSWEFRPQAYGSWASYGRLDWRGKDVDLTVEVAHNMRLERDAVSRWSKEMKLLQSLPTSSPMAITVLAEQANATKGTRKK